MKPTPSPQAPLAHMESSRLQELKRQRALVLQQLEWLDREISQASPPPVMTDPRHRLAAAIDSSGPVRQSLREDVETLSANEAAAELYSELGPDTRGAATDARRGCLALAALGFAALAALVAYTLYWY